MIEVKSIDRPDDVQEIPDGSAKLETVRLGGLTVSRVTAQPGWSWSRSLKPLVGTESCEVAHNQIIISGKIHVRMDDGTEAEAGPGDVLTASPGHDAWVIGDDPVVVYDFTLTGTGVADAVSTG
jgi:hypothetical protein